jgi:hypothetical protein
MVVMGLLKARRRLLLEVYANAALEVHQTGDVTAGFIRTG